jgi:hypothetical protein
MSRLVSTLALITIVLGIASAANADFNDRSLKGRHTGTVSITESLPDGNGGSFDAQGDELLVLDFDAAGSISGTAVVAGRVPGTSSPAFHCTFALSGSYSVAPTGIVTTTLALSSSGCGSATVAMTMAIGAFKTQLNVIVDHVDTDPPGGVNAITGHGVLIKG